MTRPYVLGLTGSIGMGKSTTAGLFAAEGVPVWDADETVHRLYAPGGAAVAAVAEVAPEAVVSERVDRARLREAILRDPGLLSRVEALVHPLVAADRERFIADAGEAPLVVVDVPLLFETGSASQVDGVLVVTAPPEVQRARVLARPGMTAAAFDGILARQTPDAEKRRRADFIIETHHGLEEARHAVREVIARLTKPREES